MAISGAAFLYISGFYGGLTKKAVQVVSAICDSTGAQVTFKNIGTDPLVIGPTVAGEGIIGTDFGLVNFVELGGGPGPITCTGIGVPCTFTCPTVGSTVTGQGTSCTKSNVTVCFLTSAGACVAAAAALNPQGVATFRDTACSTGDDPAATCRYTLTISGRATTVQVTC